MSDRNEMTPIGSAIDDMFRKIGLPDPRLMAEVRRDWPHLAAAPWAGRSRPVTIQGKTLVVEASSPSMVAFLRYGVDDLLQALEKRYGKGVFEAVDVRPPR